MFDVGDRYREVNALRKADWVDTCVKRLGSLGPIEETLRQAITPAESPGDMYSPSAFRRRVDAGKACFAQAAKGNVSRAWPELFGPLGPHVARAWQDAALRPYLFGSARPPFRGPGDEELLDDARGWFFASACQALHGLQQDAAWLAAWAPHIGLYYHDPAVLGWILAAALRNGGSDASAVRTVLYETVQGGHPVAQMGQHLVVALLNSPARSDWEVVAKLLLAAQRQEGLRQAILESMDEAQPEAFRYMLGVMLDNNLARFSATVRAYDRWTGMRWDASCV